jgi:hypothetical protein
MKCEICNTYEAHQKHHIVSRMYSGSNRNFNIASLCPNCHNDVHHGPKIIIEGRFLTDYGYSLIWHMKGEESITGMESDQVYLVRTTGTHC